MAWVAIATACIGKPDLPPYVESGNLGGDVSGGTGGTESNPVDSGTDEDGGLEGGSGTALAANESCLLSNGTCEELLSASPSGTPTCTGTIGTTCSTSNVTGCCAISDASGNNLETCYYNGSTAAGSSAATCTGVFTNQPNF